MKKIFMLLILLILNMYTLITGHGGTLNIIAIIFLSLAMMVVVTIEILEKINDDLGDDH